MTITNRYGPGLGLRDVRRWAIAGIGLWFPAYLRDAERGHGIAAGTCELPAGFRLVPQTDAAEAVPERVKAPEQRLPIILVISPGLTDRAPEQQPDGTWFTEWAVTLSGVCHGQNEADAEVVASCYGLALVQMMLQQAETWTDLGAYAGPPLRVESFEWVPPGLDFTTMAATRRRSIVAAEANFTVVFRDSASSLGPLTPPVDPSVDPGDWPEVIQTELDIDREAPSG